MLGVAAVVVAPVTPRHEHALEYFTLPEQGEAYAGIRLGEIVIWRASTSRLAMMVVKSCSVEVENTMSVSDEMEVTVEVVRVIDVEVVVTVVAIGTVTVYVLQTILLVTMDI